MRFGHFADWAHYEEFCGLIEKVWRARVARLPKAKLAEQKLRQFHAATNVVSMEQRRKTWNGVRFANVRNGR